MTARGGRPRICISLDRHWIYRLGFDWFTYRRLIRRAGGVPFTVHYHQGDVVTDSSFAFDGLLLGGGGNVDVAAYQQRGAASSLAPRDRFELDLIQLAVARALPIFGICRGCQLMNVAFGGTLTSLKSLSFHRELKRLYKHPVEIEPNSRIASVLGTTRLRSVRSLHRQAIDAPANQVRIVAWGPDKVPEAIECDLIQWGIGVQWHPELIPWGNPDQQLMADFVRAARGKL